MFKKLFERRQRSADDKKLQLYPTGKERLKYLDQKFSHFSISFSKQLKRENTYELYEEALNNDEIFLGLLKRKKFNEAYMSLSFLYESTLENFSYLLLIYANFPNITYNSRMNNNKSTGSVSDVLLLSTSSDNKSPWVKLANIYSRYYYNSIFEKRKSNSINYLFMSDFIDAWRIVFPDEVQEKVTEILEENLDCFSIESIYELSMRGYRELQGEVVDYSIFDTPVSWIGSMLTEPESVELES